MNPALQCQPHAKLYEGVSTDQRNVIAGAVVMLDPSMYPTAPATIQPIASPTMILMFLRNGEPKSSVRMMLTNDKKPSPINSGEPQGNGFGASVVGQSWNMPLVGKD